MAEHSKVAAVGDLEIGSMKEIEINHQKIVLAHTDDGYFAVADECSHDSAPISDGEVNGNEVVCVRHGARFDLKTGAVTAPPAIVPIDSYSIRIDGNDILVGLED